MKTWTFFSPSLGPAFLWVDCMLSTPRPHPTPPCQDSPRLLFYSLSENVFFFFMVPY